MKAEFKFDMDDFDDIRLHMLMLKAEDMQSMLFQFDQEVLRKATKYETSDDPELASLLQDDKVYRAVEIIRDLYFNDLNMKDIDIYI